MVFTVENKQGDDKREVLYDARGLQYLMRSSVVRVLQCYARQ
jgi:hypothetical protein